MEQLFKVGIFGAGHIARKMAATLRGMEETEPYAIASRDKARAVAFADEWGFTRSYGSYEELAHDPDVQLIYIATPHAFHYEQARMCLECDKPVLCEKAFTANAQQAEELVALSRKRGVFLGEAIWTRYMPSAKKLVELMDSGIIGRPMLLSASIGYPIADKERIVRPDLCGGALLDLGVYPINLAFALFGNNPSDVASASVKGPSGVDLQDSITLTYPDGRMAILQATAYCANDRRAVISGTDGYIVTDNINNPQEATAYNTEHEAVGHYTFPEQITGFEYEVQAAIDAIRNRAIEPEEMPHAETLKVMYLLDRLRADWGVRFPMD